MRKIFTFLFAALMSVGMWAEPITVIITNSDFPESGNTCTKDGVTITAGESFDKEWGIIYGGATFTTSLGKFTEIVISGYDLTKVSGEGWTSKMSKATWTGNASTVSFSGDALGDEYLSITFTIEPAASAGVGPREELNLGTDYPAGEHYQVLGELSGPSWISVGGNDNKTITVESLNGEIIDNITLKVYFPSSWTGYSIASTSGTVSGDVANYQDLVVTNINATSVTLSRVGEGNANGSVSFHRIIVNEGSTTAIESIQPSAVSSQKVIRNGMLLIERNGKLYNATGAEVK